MWIVIIVCVILALVCPAAERRRGEPLFKRTGPQWRRNYSRRTFLKFGGALVVSGTLAHSGVDEAVDRFHTDTIRSPASDWFSHLVKFWGERFWATAWVLMAAVDAFVRSNAVSRWGRRNFEALCIGLPMLWTTQRVLGANRPSSEDGSPRWRPMRADNSASGHAFIGAVPWLMLARGLGHRIYTPLARAASVLTGWSRINDRKHYLSQVILGLVIAWNAVEAVMGSDGAAASDDDPIVPAVDQS